MSSAVPPELRKKVLAFVAAILAACAGLVAAVGGPDPDQPVPPVPPSPPSASSSAPSPPSADGCVKPAGMTKLIDQDPTDEQLPWRRTGPGKIPVFISAPVTSSLKNSTVLTQEWFDFLSQGAAMWSQSPCLDVRVIREPCPAKANCVTVAVRTVMPDKGDDGNFDAIESGGFTTGGHIDLKAGLGNTPDGGQRRNVAAHEEGHAIGLKHRKAHVLMNGDTYNNVFVADPDEFKNLLFLYGLPS